METNCVSIESPLVIRRADFLDFVAPVRGVSNLPHLFGPGEKKQMETKKQIEFAFIKGTIAFKGAAERYVPLNEITRHDAL